MNNLKANNAVLREEARELTEEIVKCKKELALLELRISNEKSNIKKEYELLDIEKANIKSAKADLHIQDQSFNNYLKAYKLQLDEVKHEIKEKNKELAKLNSWCLQAEERHAELLRNHSEIQSKIEAGNKSLEQFNGLEQAKLRLQNEIQTLIQESSDIKNDLATTVVITNLSLQKEKDEAEHFKKLKEQEEIAYYNVRQRKLKVEHDIEIYITRASRIYEKAFPELEMKL